MAEKDGSLQTCRVVIVGGGIAGLSAANELVRNGIRDVRILEAQDGPGGRIKGMQVGDQYVELGANWIHGVLGNPIYELALTHGLVDVTSAPREHRVVALTESGGRVPFAILREVYEAYITFFKRCEEYFLRCFDPPDGIQSVGEHIKLEADLYLRGIPPQEASQHRLVFQHLLRRESCVAGCDSPDQLDLLEVGSYMELPGGNVGLTPGNEYSAILSPLLESLPPDSLQVNKPVKCVQWGGYQADEPDSDDSDRTVKGGDTYITVTCEDGTLYTCSHVICTVPLGVLKSHQDLFSPPLPAYKAEAASRLLFSAVDKIFLEYERPFLDPDVSEIILLWDESQAKPDPRESWIRKIHSFSKLSETLLLGWVSGKEAEVCESLTPQEVATSCTKVLRQFLADPYVPEPKRCIRTEWYGQPYSRGSYTAIGVGGSQLDIEMMGMPVYSHPGNSKPVLLFAGEHTHPCFYSTVHGAYLSGRSAARLLCCSDDSESDLKEDDEDKEQEEEEEIQVLQADGITDLSSWVQGISLE